MGRANIGDGQRGGNLFIHSDNHTLLIATPIEWHVLTTGANTSGFINLTIQADDSPILVELYENVSEIGAGVALELYNKNRLSNVIAQSTVYEFNDADINAAGAILLETNRIPLGGKSGGVIGTSSEPYELKPNTKYGFKITNATSPLKDTTVALRMIIGEV